MRSRHKQVCTITVVFCIIRDIAQWKCSLADVTEWEGVAMELSDRMSIYIFFN